MVRKDKTHIQTNLYSSVICVAIGGALGALSRFYISQMLSVENFGFGATYAFLSQSIEQATTLSFPQFLDIFITLFPLGTLGVNILGSYTLGCFLSFYQSTKHSDNTTSMYQNKIQFFFRQLLLGHSFYAFFVIGFLGSFTTFSAFSLESMKLLLPSIFYFFDFIDFSFRQEISMHISFMHEYFENVFGITLEMTIVMHSLLLACLNILINLMLCLVAVCFGLTRYR